MIPLRLLLVDDDEDLREMLVEQLSLYEEFVVLEEGSATKGIQAARGSMIDLLVTGSTRPDWRNQMSDQLSR